MPTRHLISLPEHERNALLFAARSPDYAGLFERLPALRAALLTPVADELLTLAESVADLVVDASVAADTQALAQRLSEQMRAQESAQQLAQANTAPAPAIKRYNNTQCPCCGGGRIVQSYSKACDSNSVAIPHLAFEHFGYMPSGIGVPGSSDGPELEVCLDCGRIVNAEFPVLDSQVLKRIEDA